MIQDEVDEMRDGPPNVAAQRALGHEVGRLMAENAQLRTWYAEGLGSMIEERNEALWAAKEACLALFEAAKMVELFSGLISKACYEAEELEQGAAAWLPVSDTMYDGTMASYKDTFETAIKRIQNFGNVNS
jgi:hypothetical protein